MSTLIKTTFGLIPIINRAVHSRTHTRAADNLRYFLTMHSKIWAKNTEEKEKKKSETQNCNIANEGLSEPPQRVKFPFVKGAMLIIHWPLKTLCFEIFALENTDRY